MNNWPAWSALVGVLLAAAAGGLLIWLRQTDRDHLRLSRDINYLAACINDLTETVEDITSVIERRNPDHENTADTPAEPFTPTVPLILTPPSPMSAADVIDMVEQAVPGSTTRLRAESTDRIVTTDGDAPADAEATR